LYHAAQSFPIADFIAFRAQPSANFACHAFNLAVSFL